MYCESVLLLLLLLRQLFGSLSVVGVIGFVNRFLSNVIVKKMSWERDHIQNRVLCRRGRFLVHWLMASNATWDLACASFFFVIYLDLCCSSWAGRISERNNSTWCVVVYIYVFHISTTLTRSLSLAHLDVFVVCSSIQIGVISILPLHTYIYSIMTSYKYILVILISFPY